MSVKKAWAKALAQPAQEFPATHLPILSGQIPEGLRGTLYRNGPGRLERGGVPVGHWFDGDNGYVDEGGIVIADLVRYEDFQTNRYLAEGADISQEMFGAIACFDTQTHTVTETDLGENRYGSEPLYVQDAHNPEGSWVLTVVWDGNSEASEVWVFDSDALDREPICQLGLPGIVPFGFHGTWNSDC